MTTRSPTACSFWSPAVRMYQQYLNHNTSCISTLLPSLFLNSSSPSLAKCAKDVGSAGLPHFFKLHSESEPKTHKCILRWPWCSTARAEVGFGTTEPWYDRNSSHLTAQSRPDTPIPKGGPRHLDRTFLHPPGNVIKASSVKVLPCRTRPVRTCTDPPPLFLFRAWPRSS